MIMLFSSSQLNRYMREAKIPTTKPINRPLMAQENLNIPVDTSMNNTTKKIKMKKKYLRRRFIRRFSRYCDEKSGVSFFILIPYSIYNKKSINK